MTTLSLYESLLKLEQADPFFASATPPPLSPSTYYYFDTPAPGTPSSSSSSTSTPRSASASTSSSSRRSSSSAYSLSAPRSLTSSTSHALASAYYASQSLDDALDMAKCEYNMLLDWMVELVADYQGSSSSSPTLEHFTSTGSDGSRASCSESSSVAGQHSQTQECVYPYGSKEHTIYLQQAEISRVNLAIIEQAQLVRSLSSQLKEERRRRRRECRRRSSSTATTASISTSTSTSASTSRATSPRSTFSDVMARNTFAVAEGGNTKKQYDGYVGKYYYTSENSKRSMSILWDTELYGSIGPGHEVVVAAEDHSHQDAELKLESIFDSASFFRSPESRTGSIGLQ